MQGITLPCTLPDIQGLVKTLEGEGTVKEVAGKGVQEAADLLGIQLQGLDRYNGLNIVGPNSTQSAKVTSFKMEFVKAVESLEKWNDTEEGNNGSHVNTGLQLNKALDSDSNLDSETESDSDLMPETELTNDLEEKGSPALDHQPQHLFLRRYEHKKSNPDKIKLQRKFECKKCDYKAKKSQHMKAHILAVHEGARFNCKQCNFTASAMTSVTTHTKLKHTNHPGYICDICEKKYKSHTGLKIHKKDIHGEVRLTNFDCKLCSYITTHEGYLREHLLNCHGTKDKSPNKSKNIKYVQSRTRIQNQSSNTNLEPNLIDELLEH